jgi:hypothetical protein
MTEEFVTVASYSRPGEARLVLGHLQDAGILAFLSGELTASFLGDSGAFGPQVTLHVARSDLKCALDVLAWLRDPSPLPDDWSELPGDTTVWLCADCGEAVEDELDLCPYCHAPRPGR